LIKLFHSYLSCESRITSRNSLPAVENRGICREGLGQWVINSVAIYSCEVEAVLRTAISWVVRQRVVVISYRRFRTTIGPIGSSEIMVRNYHYLLCNNPEEPSSLLLRGGSLKLCVRAVLLVLN